MWAEYGLSSSTEVMIIIIASYWQSTRDRNHSAAATRGNMEPPAARLSGLLSFQQLTPQLKHIGV